MKLVPVLAVLVSALGLAASSAAGGTVIDYPANVQGYRFITDTLGGNGQSRTAQATPAALDRTLGRPSPEGPYRFISDTLADSYRSTPVTAPPSSRGFSFGSAGAGAAATLGAVLVAMAATILARRRRPSF